MLDKIGVSSVDALFSDIPDKLKRPDYNVPNAYSELALRAHFSDLEKKNQALTIF